MHYSIAPYEKAIVSNLTSYKKKPLNLKQFPPPQRQGLALVCVHTLVTFSEFRVLQTCNTGLLEPALQREPNSKVQ